MSKPWEKQKAWIQFSESQQVYAAQFALDICTQTLGLQGNVLVQEVKDNDRFVLTYEQDPTKPDFGSHMIKLETLMRQTMGVVVDLRLETKEDKNKRAGRNGRE